MPLVHNEQVKLTATAVSSSAVALGLAGSVAPIIGFSLGVQPGVADPIVYLRMVLWLAISAIIHLIARAILMDLRNE